MSSKTKELPTKTLLDVKELAARWGLSTTFVRKLVLTNETPKPIRFGRLLRFPLAEVEAWEARVLEESRGV